jgi:hypothetical protein
VNVDFDHLLALTDQPGRAYPLLSYKKNHTDIKTQDITHEVIRPTNATDTARLTALQTVHSNNRFPMDELLETTNDERSTPHIRASVAEQRNTTTIPGEETPPRINTAIKTVNHTKKNPCKTTKPQIYLNNHTNTVGINTAIGLLLLACYYYRRALQLTALPVPAPNTGTSQNNNQPNNKNHATQQKEKTINEFVANCTDTWRTTYNSTRARTPPPATPPPAFTDDRTTVQQGLYLLVHSIHDHPRNVNQWRCRGGLPRRDRGQPVVGNLLQRPTRDHQPVLPRWQRIHFVTTPRSNGQTRYPLPLEGTTQHWRRT